MWKAFRWFCCFCFNCICLSYIYCWWSFFNKTLGGNFTKISLKLNFNRLAMWRERSLYIFINVQYIKPFFTLIYCNVHSNFQEKLKVFFAKLLKSHKTKIWFHSTNVFSQIHKLFIKTLMKIYSYLLWFYLYLELSRGRPAISIWNNLLGPGAV